MAKGIFITLEGIEGVGKSTHASFIVDLLEKQGREVVLTREPGGTEAGEAIRDILLSNKNQHKVSDDLELLLMFAARAQHLQEIIVPALTMNKVVICAETLGALEDALENFAGCAVIISHDRMFLDRLATHILSFEGDSHVEWFEGNFEDYEQDKIRRLGPESVNPKRVTYKRLTR